MKKQTPFTDMEYSYRKKKTKRKEFLETMDEIIPWEEWGYHCAFLFLEKTGASARGD